MKVIRKSNFDHEDPGHRVSVDSGKYTFVVPADDYRVSILRYGKPWHGPQGEASNALHAIMYELDAARVVVQAFRDLVAPGNDRLSTREGFNRITEALAKHDSLVSDRESPSAWCGVEPIAPTVAGPEKCPRCRFTPCRQMFQCRAPDRPRNQYGEEMALTEMCLELHQGTDGDRRAELLAFLEYKLEHWTTSPSQSDGRAFDDAVHALVVAALAETPPSTSAGRSGS